jgi:predicted unusual protein kinase regulating ubiquinone biosynthesis (AarF/ABC1/UbiB family)
MFVATDRIASSLKKTVRFYLGFEHKRLIKKYTPRQLGAWCKDQLVDMGPTFIKIGQFVSTRSDVFGKDITDELKELQDNVAPLAWSSLKDTIPVNVFTDIQETPVASASIGQVHVAKIGDKEVVLKVKRPNIDEQIRSDFEGLLVFIKAMKVISSDRRLIEFEILFTEYYNLLLQEIDFKLEADNMERFSKMFKNTPWIRIPNVYKKYCSESCITMEYVPSIKINDIEKLKQMNFSTEKISTKLVECYVDQIIKHGSVHIDPHPGNLGMTKSGQIVFYDYGMVLDLDQLIQKHFDELLLAIYNRDIDEIAALAVKIGLVVVEDKNLPYFKKFLMFFVSYIEKMDVNDFKISYIDKIDKSNMPFLISSKFLLLLRGISILEGLCKQLNPNFNYKKPLDNYISEYLINIRYLENRAMADISSIRTMPGKLSEQKIEIEIISMNNEINAKTRTDLTKKKTIILGLLTLLVGAFDEESIHALYIMLVSIVLAI